MDSFELRWGCQRPCFTCALNTAKQEDFTAFLGTTASIQPPSWWKLLSRSPVKSSLAAACLLSTHGTTSRHILNLSLSPGRCLMPGAGAAPGASPAALSPGWGSGMCPGCQNLPCWLQMEDAPSSLPTKWFCLICTSMQQRLSNLQALLQSLPLAVSLCSSAQAMGQIHVSSETSTDPSGVGFYQLLLAPMQIQCSLHRIFSEHRRRPVCLFETENKHKYGKFLDVRYCYLWLPPNPLEQDD